MVLSKREKIAAVATLAAVAVLVLDRYLFSPILDRISQLGEQKAALQGQLSHAELLFKRRAATDAKWNALVAGGLKSNASETENLLLNSIREWAQDAGLTLSSVRPERTTQKAAAPEVSFLVVGTGPMSAITKFLWRMETSAQPVKGLEMQLRSRREGTDDLSLQVRVSALYLSDNLADTLPAVAAGGRSGS